MPGRGCATCADHLGRELTVRADLPIASSRTKSMSTTAATPADTATSPEDIRAAGAMSAAEMLRCLGVSDLQGLSSTEVSVRRTRWGPNAVSSHKARFWPVLWHQLRSPLLALLLTAALASYFVGERSDAVIIGVIVALSVGLGFVNEYRAERAAEALHNQIHHEAVVTRDGKATSDRCHRACPGRSGRAETGGHRASRPAAAVIGRARLRRVGADR